MRAILDRHERIALEFSGGRDSLACLYLLRPHLDRMTVYWVNTGAAFPETLAVVEEVRSFVPNFIEIEGNQPGVVAQFGIPTDLLPRSATPIGVVTGKSPVLMQDSYSCCARVIMEPLHRRVLGDGCTLIIRGQKRSDDHRAPFSSGFIEHGIEYLFPIEDWSQEDVTAYLKKQNAPVPAFYESMSGAPDCMTCSGWWNEGRGQYLRVHHPEAHAEYQRRMRIILDQSSRHIEQFNQEYQGDENV